MYFVTDPPSRPVFRIGSTMVSGTVSVILGANVTVKCDALSNPTSSYKWNNYSSSVITYSRNLYLRNVEISDEGTYNCTASNRMVPSTGYQQTGTNSSFFTLDILCKCQHFISYCYSFDVNGSTLR